MNRERNRVWNLNAEKIFKEGLVAFYGERSFLCEKIDVEGFWLINYPVQNTFYIIDPESEFICLEWDTSKHEVYKTLETLYVTQNIYLCEECESLTTNHGEDVICRKCLEDRVDAIPL